MEKNQISFEKEVDKTFPHASNLITKNNLYLDKNSQSKLKEIIKNYGLIFDFVKDQSDVTEKFLQKYISLVDNYLNLLRTDRYFSHQSDLISSVIPELFCQIYKIKIKEMNLNYIVSGQENLKVDFQFQNTVDKKIVFKEKRVDVAVYENANILINDDKVDLIIPVVALEIKVNLDKNMIYGIINTSESIKKLYPNSLYYLITEFADLNLSNQNFKYSEIDEIYILRKQKRSNFRRSGKILNLDKSLIEHNLRLFEDKILKDSEKNNDLETRMKQYGKLIL